MLSTNNQPFMGYLLKGAPNHAVVIFSKYSYTTIDKQKDRKMIKSLTNFKKMVEVIFLKQCLDAYANKKDAT